ncbi:hypothetical protein TRFO_30119 [Tritrichomonas foetus]|uniref:Uncharacterized protein n=1 Tax=Tritrichomonas foetus TaxID=1144522 RepID=A0A1J4JVG1_9EUKA|nr:hypothetical protein TRFO_30119 [Tritrichomonas foetus]|eukprot:OHT02714.1 hypothetical protein TRFO_30119 [Tritrichomonas foetus]
MFTDKENLSKRTSGRTKKSNQKPHVSFSHTIKPSPVGFSSVLTTDNTEISSDSYVNETIEKTDFQAKNENENEEEEKLKKRIRSLEKKNDVLMTDLKENCQLLKSIQVKLNESTQELVNKSNEIVSLKKQLNEITENAKMNQQNVEQLNDNDQNLGEIKQLNDELKEEKVKYDELLNSYNCVEQEKTELQNDNKLLKEEFEKQKNAMVEKDTEILKLNEQLEQLNERNKSLSNQINEYQAEIEDYRTQETENDHYNELSSIVKVIRDQNNQLTKENEMLKRKNDQLQSIIEENYELKKEIEKKDQEISEFCKVQDNYSNYIKELETKNQELEEIIAEMKTHLHMPESDKTQIDSFRIQENLIYELIIDDFNDMDDHNNCQSTREEEVSDNTDDESDLLQSDESDDSDVQDPIYDRKQAGRRRNYHKHSLRFPNSPEFLNHHDETDQYEYEQNEFDESNSFMSEASSAFDFTETNSSSSPEMKKEKMNGNNTYFQQLIAATQKNKALRESNAKLESFASSIMSEYTEALNKIKMLENKTLLKVDENSVMNFEVETQNEFDSEKLIRTLNQMKKDQEESLAKLINEKKNAIEKEIAALKEKHQDSLHNFEIIEKFLCH